MPEVLDPLPCRVQPLSERLVPRTGGEGIVEAVDPALFLSFALQFKPLELG